MLSRCANSQCSKPFLRLGQGKLFLVERDSLTKTGTPGPPSRLTRPQLRRVERYWLCDECAEAWTLVYDRKDGILLVPLPRSPATTVAMTIAMKEEYRESA
jgi:hypothetical protein